MNDEFLQGIENLPEIKYYKAREDRALARHSPITFEINGVTYKALPQDASVEPAGYWRDVIIRDGKVEEISSWKSNLVVNAFAVLVAALTRGNGAGTGDYVDASSVTWRGIQYMELGTGLESWDTGGNPAPTLSDTALVTPLARQAVTVGFVDSTQTPPAASTTPTNALLIQATFGTGAANGTLREWALFGGNATATLGSGQMVDRVTTPALSKPSGVNDFTLTRLVTLIY